MPQHTCAGCGYPIEDLNTKKCLACVITQAKAVMSHQGSALPNETVFAAKPPLLEPSVQQPVPAKAVKKWRLDPSVQQLVAVKASKTWRLEPSVQQPMPVKATNSLATPIADCSKDRKEPVKAAKKDKSQNKIQAKPPIRKSIQVDRPNSSRSKGGSLRCILCGKKIKPGELLFHKSKVHGEQMVVPSSLRGGSSSTWVHVVSGGLPSLGKRS